MHKIITVVGLLTLTSCAAVQENALARCTADLFGAGSSDPAALLRAAASSAACQSLAVDVLNGLINSVSVKQRARGVR